MGKSLIDRAPKPWQRVGLALVAIGLMVAWGVLVDLVWR